MSGVPPVIGLTSYREPTRWGAWHEVADLLTGNYSATVTKAGAIPVLLPASDPTVLDRLDGLVISGGPDVDPARYAARPHPRAGEPRTVRDAWELDLLDGAAARGMPVLGVCRGMQVMAVHAGGSLDQHVPDLVGHERHSPGPDAFGDTEVVIDAGSRLAEVLGETRTIVSCHHHQSVAAHPGLNPVARAADGLLEAIEHPDREFWLGIQWHPEHREEDALFRGLAAAARAYRHSNGAGSPAP
ncbi:putative glutamine amidotransferase [Naumannella cuiyingiana]|uniref:Putative glutamine amidotransferase n=1 Tax=Naumannella cuiyingiana TaxID=1347891 RepID=A0A7Z0DBY5_9ACTN|nr:putative glutamine amidotransferase [Naumannella cuiyingiana]